jgi:hydrogenase nickel incorporation protein HypA/HybF
MHEMAIATELLEQVLRVAAEHHATRVDEVQVEVGMMCQIVPEALTLAFTAAAEGTIAAGATLRIHEERAVAVCCQCECMFLPEIDRFICPQCKRADARIISGNDIVLASMTCETDDGNEPVDPYEHLQHAG